MDTLLFFVKSQFAIILFYFIYEAFLDKRINPKIARFYILLSVPVSFIISFSWFNYSLTDTSLNLISFIEPILIIYDNESVVNFSDSENIFLASLLWENVFKIVYVLGIIFFITYVLINKVRFNKNIKAIKYITYRDIPVRINNCGAHAFALRNEIQISNIFYEKYKGSIIYKYVMDHEYIHCKKFHWLDIIFMMILKSLLWFNPVVWLMDRALREVHEYETDINLIKDGINVKQYAQLLLNMEMGTPLACGGNYFSYLSIKKRIIMMNTKIRLSYLRILAVIPVIMLFISPLMSAPKIIKESNDLNLNSTNAFIQTQDNKAIPYSQLTYKPTYNGGDINEFTKWVFQNIKYPKLAREYQVQGMVLLSFVIGADGKVSDVKVERGIKDQTGDKTISVTAYGDDKAKKINVTPQMRAEAIKELEDEAVNVVMKAETFTPGKLDGKVVPVKMMFPVKFLLK